PSRSSYPMTCPAQRRIIVGPALRHDRLPGSPIRLPAMRKTSRLFAATLALSLAQLVAPGAVLAADFDTCLVLGGGGARGMAHIGVIKVLERERIPVDCIVGTSMGAVIGSLYASGLGATEIETQMRALDWNTMF